MTQKEQLKNNLEYLTEEQSELINKLIRLDDMSKTEMLNIYLTPEQVNKIDFGIPQDIFDEITGNKWPYVWDYNEARIFGQLHSIAEKLFWHIKKTFQTH